MLIFFRELSTDPPLSVIPAKAGIHKYFSGEKSSGHTSTRQPPVLRLGPTPTSQSVKIRSTKFEIRNKFKIINPKFKTNKFKPNLFMGLPP
jgi:hypothetical protein